MLLDEVRLVMQWLVIWLRKVTKIWFLRCLQIVLSWWAEFITSLCRRSVEIALLYDLREFSCFHLKFSNSCVLLTGDFLIFLSFLLEECDFVCVDMFYLWPATLYSFRLYNLSFGFEWFTVLIEHLVTPTYQVLHLLIHISPSEVHFPDLTDLKLWIILPASTAAMVLLSFPTAMLLPSLPATIIFSYFLTTISFFSVWLQLFLGTSTRAIRSVFLPTEGVVFPICCRAMIMDLFILPLWQ